MQALVDHGVNAAVAITAVTAQTDERVISIAYLSGESVREQIQSALRSREIAAIKIGMLGRGEIVRAVIESLPSRDATPIVLDPVLVASSGRCLLDDEGCAMMRSELCARVTLLTPNLPEAASLLNELVAENEPAMGDQAQRLLAWGSKAILLKGGHASAAESTDVLVTKDGTTLNLSAPRIAAKMRGTGCMLSSAIAAGLAKGMTLADACSLAKHYVTRQFQLSCS
jgi:hydroxymethylpyrimidine/phosphomethylpyrimidine kinase